MFGNSQIEGNSLGECKPDPEEMLQRARQRIEACDRAERLIFELDELPIHVSDKTDSFKQALGQIAIERRRAKKDEAHWLAEMNST